MSGTESNFTLGFGGAWAIRSVLWRVNRHNVFSKVRDAAFSDQCRYVPGPETQIEWPLVRVTISSLRRSNVQISAERSLKNGE